MENYKIAIIGKMGSGKSTLAKSFNWNIISHSTILKIITRCEKVKDRKLLQSIGTKMREIDPDIFINATIDATQNNLINYVNDDTRYKNEAIILQKNNWILIKLVCKKEIRLRRCGDVGIDNHESEFCDLPYNLIFENDDNPETIINIKNQILNSEVLRKLAICKQ